MERDDVKLIYDTLDGDDSAFSDLVRKYQKSVHALAWRKIGDFHIAEEIAQDTFLQAYRKLPTLKNPRQFPGWLYVIAERRCKAWFRKKQQYMQSLEATDLETLEKIVYLDYICEQREEEAVEYRRKIVQKLLEKLPESERTVTVLFYLGEMSYEAISKFLGVSPNTVKSRLKRARERLKQEESIINESLRSFQFPPNFTENIMQQLDKVKHMAPQSSKPLPWLAFASSTLLAILLIGAGNQVIKSKYQPYSLEANSESAIEIVEAPDVFNVQSKPDLHNLAVQDSLQGRNKNYGQTHGTESIQNDLTRDAMQWNLPENVKTRFGKGRIREIDYSPDGTILAVATDICIWIYDASTFQEITMFPADSTRFNSISFVGNDRISTIVGGDPVVLLWDKKNGVLRKTPTTKKSEIAGVASSAESQTIESEDGGRIEILIINTSAKKKPKKKTKKGEDSIAHKDRNMIITTSSDETRLVDINRFNHNEYIHANHADFVSTVAFSEDQTIMASGNSDYNILLWDTPSRKLKKTLSGHTANIVCIEFSPDAKTIVSTSDDGTMRFWETETARLKKTIKGFSMGVNSVSLSPNGKSIASTNRDGTIDLWDISTEKKINTIVGYPDKFEHLGFNPSGYIIACGNGRLSIWDPKNTERKKILSGHITGTHCFASTSDGITLATGHENSEVKLWNSQTGKQIQTLTGHNRRVYSVAFSPDGKMLASASDDDTIRLWDINTGKEQTTLTGHTGGVKSVAFSPDGKTLASGDGQSLIILWDLTTEKVRKRCIGHEHWVFCLAFSPDGNTLVSGGKDNNINLWDINTGEVKKTLKGHTNCVKSITISPDGDTLVSGSDDGTILIWDIKQ